VIAYAESSAVLAWVLGEPEGEQVRQAISVADRVVASTLTPLECARAIERGAASGRLTEAEALAARGLLDAASRTWVLLEMTGPVPLRAARRFPSEPVRTLDAIHLATALEFYQALGGLTMVSLDERVRDNARRLGMTVAE
jgi:uncharacterized protein with PIN domain